MSEASVLCRLGEQFEICLALRLGAPKKSFISQRSLVLADDGKRLQLMQLSESGLGEGMLGFVAWSCQIDAIFEFCLNFVLCFLGFFFCECLSGGNSGDLEHWQFSWFGMPV